jgi:hypothetical protein
MDEEAESYAERVLKDVNQANATLDKTTLRTATPKVDRLPADPPSPPDREEPANPRNRRLRLKEKLRR